MSTLYSYATGFVLSIILTVAAFGLVNMHISGGHGFPSHQILVPTLIALAVIQLCVQLFFFLHVGRSSQGWNITLLLFALLIVSILVGGTLWIMHNVQHSTMQEVYMGGEVSPQTEAL